MFLSRSGPRGGAVFAVACAAVFAVAGCSSDKDDTAAPSPPTPTASAAPSPSVAATPAGPVLTAEQLMAIKLPTPKFAPAKGKWTDPIAPAEGSRNAEFIDGEDPYLNVQLVDCNLPDAAQYADKKVFNRNVFDNCFGSEAGGDQPAGTTIHGSPVWKINEQVRYLRVGHLGIRATLGDKAPATLGGADLETFIKSLDLDAIAKL